MELYKTIKKEAIKEQIIEKSRFIAHAKPIDTREEAEAFIAQIKAQYKDATHNVPAMVIGDGSQIQWASDDGEPQGTSGAPMVHMMVSEGLTNLVVVVTRYFGGIKLGTGGLVRAYTSSAKLAIEAAEVCSVMEVCRMTVQVDYTYLAKIQQISLPNGKLSKPGTDNQGSISFVIGAVEYGEKVIIEIITSLENEAATKELIANITSGSAVVIKTVSCHEKV